MCQLDPDLIDDNDAVNGAFDLTYANYPIWHRSLMEAMPVDWQRRFAQLVREYWAVYDPTGVP